MSTLNQTPSADRIRIGFFGLRNAGKSSLVNAVTGQALSVVSDVAGTTTDPVKKAMELLPLGPVVIIDTPGLDDEGTLGELRVQKAREVLATVHIAVLVVDAARGVTPSDETLLSLFEERKLPYIVAMNKLDLLTDTAPLPTIVRPQGIPPVLPVSAAAGTGIRELKEALAAHARDLGNPRKLISDLLSPRDLVVLVIPIDEAAPKGRLILPQQQTIRDILDAHCSAICCQETELAETLSQLSVKPALVVTDSQAFGQVAKVLPPDQPLTSFSILFARYKGDLPSLIQGAATLSHLKDGDRILISEGCTHHRQCADIGTVKLPRWVEQFSGVTPQYTFTSGGEFPQDLSEYKLIIHCGGCMLSEKEMAHRMAQAAEVGVPMVNYGVAIAHMHGILKRSLAPFPDVAALLP